MHCPRTLDKGARFPRPHESTKAKTVQLMTVSHCLEYAIISYAGGHFPIGPTARPTPNRPHGAAHAHGTAHHPKGLHYIQQKHIMKLLFCKRFYNKLLRFKIKIMKVWKCVFDFFLESRPHICNPTQIAQRQYPPQ